MKKALAIIVSLAVVVLSVTPYVFFENDTLVSANPENALEYLYDKNIIEGYPDGQLHPEYTLTRAQFAKILINAFPDGVSNLAEYMFSDLESTHWAYSYIQKSANAGWINGYTDGTFRPDENIIYEQALTIICRVINLSTYGANYPEDYIAAAIDTSVSDGVDALIGEVINRRQTAQLIINAMNYKSEQRETASTNIISIGGGGGSVGYTSSSVMTAPLADTNYYSETILPGEEYIYGESYTANDENTFKDAVTSPLSTFSIDADTASYSNMRRFILNGQKIPSGSIRSEELINYFEYTKAPTEEDKPFGVNFTVSQCPWNSENLLAMVTVSGEELTEPKPSNIVFLIDTSGSMYSYNKLPLVKQSLSMLLDKLGENDRISIVTYASGTGVALEPTPAMEKEKILGVINNLQAGGATAGASGINLAYEQAEKYICDGNNRVILCTDGDFNVGITSDGDLLDLIEEKREKNIYLSVLGFGMGNYKDSRMELLADNGNGNYAYIDNLREAKKVLADEMSKTIYTIAKDVKIQVEFNPETVLQYRLVGYENRLLNNEDFENDQKDAGELGSGATVTVLYEIVPNNETPNSPLKYQNLQTTGSDELMTVKIRYKLPDKNESILSEYPIPSQTTDVTDDFKFAAAVAQLGMILNNSEYMGTSTLDSVITLAKQGIGDDPYGIRNEFIHLVDLLRYQMMN